MTLRCSILIAGLIQLGTAAPALAQEWEASTQRFLGAPGFLPSASQVEGVFTYTYAKDLYDYRPDEPYGRTQEYDRSKNEFLPAVTYGLTDDISISADLGWGNARNLENYTYYRFIPAPVRTSGNDGRFGVIPALSFGTFKLTHAATSYHTLGADNPSFSVIWRAIDQRAAPVNVDITASYSPDIFKSIGAGADQTGSVASGGQSGSVQLAVMRDMRFLTLRGYGTFAYEGRRNESQNGGYDDLRGAAHAAYEVGLQSQARLLPWFAVNAGVSALQAMRYDQAELSAAGEAVTTVKPGASVEPYAGVALSILPHRLVTEFLYEHAFVSDETHVGVGYEDRYSKQESNAFIARVLFTIGGSSAPLPVPPNTPARMPRPFGPDYNFLVIFDWDRADLSARARQIITKAAHETTWRLVTRIDVNGYTDLSGGAAYNEKLSIRRARSVEAELVRDGVNRDEISVHGYGESYPLVPTAAGIREPQNRRVEIIFH
jgi:outer membrane protein OmpA-like peptidoglycan-associated protein